MMDWTPETHDRFRGFSLREGQELLAQVPLLPAKGGITDLGCGSGTGGALLRAHFARRPLHGVDGSGRRLEEAEATGHYTSLESADIADWQPREAMALIFANGVLQRLGNHPALLPRLARGLCPGGVLAVQMPLEQAAPALVLLRALLDGLAGGQSRARAACGRGAQRIAVCPHA